MNKLFKIRMAIILNFLLCSVFVFGANSSSEILDKLSTANEEELIEIQILSDLSKKIGIQLSAGIETESQLKYYRAQLSAILADVKSLTIQYKAKLESARNVVNDFAVSTEGKKADETFKVKYDDFYLKKMQEYRQRVSFYKGVLLRLRLTQEQCYTNIGAIEEIRQEMYIGNLWVSNEPFYKLSAWQQAFSELRIYSTRLAANLFDISDNITQSVLTMKFWLLLIGFILGAGIYLKSIRPRANLLIKKTTQDHNFINSMTKKFFVVFIYVIVRGAIPVLLIFLLKNIVLDTLGLDRSPLLAPFINSFFNALAFIVIMLALIFVMLNQNLEFIKFKEANFFQRQIIIIIFEIGAIFFIKNINFFSTGAPAAAYYPDQATALINLFISFLIVISFYRLCYSKRSQLEGAK